MHSATRRPHRAQHAHTHVKINQTMRACHAYVMLLRAGRMGGSGADRVRSRACVCATCSPGDVMLAGRLTVPGRDAGRDRAVDVRASGRGGSRGAGVLVAWDAGRAATLATGVSVTPASVTAAGLAAFLVDGDVSSSD